MSEPFSVERLREMMDGAPPEMREHSTVLWAADEIERLRALTAELRSVATVRMLPSDVIVATVHANISEAQAEHLKAKLSDFLKTPVMVIGSDITLDVWRKETNPEESPC